jgi:hypothetical protein
VSEGRRVDSDKVRVGGGGLGKGSGVQFAYVIFEQLRQSWDLDTRTPNPSVLVWVLQRNRICLNWLMQV